MLGEAWIAIDSLTRDLNRLTEERELFRLWGEEHLHPFVYEKRMRRYDDEISVVEDELAEWSGWYDMIVEDEYDPACDETDAEVGSFNLIFEELCQIEGVRTPGDCWDW